MAAIPIERGEKGESDDVVSVRFGQVDDDQRKERGTFGEVCAEAVGRLVRALREGECLSQRRRSSLRRSVCPVPLQCVEPIGKASGGSEMDRQRPAGIDCS